jgi:hypothetical protein
VRDRSNISGLRKLVRRARRVRIAAMLLVLVPAAVAVPAALAARGPGTETMPATDVTDTAATLNAVIMPDGHDTAFRFEYASPLYSRVTPVATVPGDRESHAVSMTVQDLAPDTPHTFRVVAWRADERGDRVTVGAELTFRTEPAAPPASATQTQTPLAPAAPAPVPGAVPPPQAPPPGPAPELGRTVVVQSIAGSVSVQPPGTPAFTPLPAAGSVPVGVLVDARRGTVRLTTALPDGRVQVGEFHGGLFEVRRQATASGAIELRLRGANFALCPRRASGARASAAAAKRRKRPVRRLWSRDNSGRFLTRGRNSVATVRGTRWVTTDTCAGTRTTVTEGAVAVRDLRRKRTVVVRAGHSYLARSRR